MARNFRLEKSKLLFFTTWFFITNDGKAGLLALILMKITWTAAFGML